MSADRGRRKECEKGHPQDRGRKKTALTAGLHRGRVPRVLEERLTGLHAERYREQGWKCRGGDSGTEIVSFQKKQSEPLIVEKESLSRPQTKGRGGIGKIQGELKGAEEEPPERLVGGEE